MLKQHLSSTLKLPVVAMMTATFGRIEAALAMNVTDYFDDGKNWSIKLATQGARDSTIDVTRRLLAEK